MRTHTEHAKQQPSSKPFESFYRGYVVKFRPQPTPDGRYLAYAVISRQFGGIQTAGSETPDLPSFASQNDAAIAGLAAGKRWVDLHG